MTGAEVDVREYLNGRKFTVLFSGGKDSLAALLWILDNVEHGGWNVLYVEVAGNTHPLCTKYVYEVVERLGLSERLVHARTADFFELMDRWGPPLMFAYRWCLTQKDEAIRRHAHFVTVSGVKRSDSRARSKLPALSFYRRSDRLDVKPILDWTDGDVYKYIKEHNVPVNPCYKLYGHSGNCMFCPYADRKHVVGVMSDPEWRAKIEGALLRHRERMMRGSIGRDVYERWMRWAGQLTLA